MCLLMCLDAHNVSCYTRNGCATCACSRSRALAPVRAHTLALPPCPVSLLLSVTHAHARARAHTHTHTHTVTRATEDMRTRMEADGKDFDEQMKETARTVGLAAVKYAVSVCVCMCTRVCVCVCARAREYVQMYACMHALRTHGQLLALHTNYFTYELAHL